MRAIDLRRHDHNIHNIIVQWFTMIGREITNPAIQAEHIYNIDKTSVQIGVLNSMKLLVGRDVSRRCTRLAGVFRPRKRLLGEECHDTLNSVMELLNNKFCLLLLLSSLRLVFTG